MVVGERVEEVAIATKRIFESVGARSPVVVRQVAMYESANVGSIAVGRKFDELAAAKRSRPASQHPQTALLGESLEEALLSMMSGTSIGLGKKFGGGS